jgi:phospholipase C
MKLSSIAAVVMFVMAIEALPTSKKTGKQLPGLEKIKHVVYFMQVNVHFIICFFLVYSFYFFLRKTVPLTITMVQW